MFKKNQPKIFFDCVSGELGGKVFSAMPRETSTYVYGALDLTPYSLPAGEFLFTDKILRGFWMSTYLSQNPKLVPELNKQVMENLEGGDYKMTVSKRFKYENWEEAVEYYQNNMSKGKVLLQANPKPKL